MARLPIVQPGASSPAVAAALAKLPPMNMLRLVANADAVFEPWLRFAGAVLNETTLDPVLRELAILRVAALSPGADYEWDQHVVIARDVGVSEAQIEAARTGAGAGGAALSGDDALVCRFTEQVVRDVSPSDATFAAIAARFSTREIVELLLVIGQYMLVARLAATARIDPDPPAGSSLLAALTGAATRE